VKNEKWAVWGLYGGQFTNLKEACKCAKNASIEEGEAYVTEIKTDTNYILYKNGKKVFDGWIIKRN
jgi:hypothetical protein